MGVGGLHELISGLADSDLGVLDDAALHAEVVELGRLVDHVQVVFAARLREWDNRRVFETDGSKSAAHRLARELKSSVAGCKETMARARRLDDVPATVVAVMDGRLSLDHLDLFARTNTPARRELFARDERMLIGQCEGLHFFQAAKLLRYWANRADDLLQADQPAADGDPTIDDTATEGTAAEGTVQPDEPVGDEVSRLHASRSLHDTLELQGTLGAIDGNIVQRELDRLAEAIRQADVRAGITRTGSQRRAAALVEMASRSATAPADGRRPEPLFQVVIGSDTMDHLCELSNGTVITPGELVPWISRAMLETMLFSGPRTVLTVSSRRTFIGALRRAIQVRDLHCQHPAGCDTPAEDCHIDHIVPWAHGGPTSQFNARALCEPQNVLPHLRGQPPVPLPEQQVNPTIATIEQLRWRYQHEPPPPGMHLEWRWAPDHPDSAPDSAPDTGTAPGDPEAA